jgi:hypothetical protein
MKLDWKNINWKALAQSNIVRGAVAVIIASSVSISGHTADPQATQAATDSVMQIVANGADFVTLAGGLYALFHRVTAQPETTATIIPKKPQT